MKGKIIIEAIEEDEVNAVAEAEGWDGEGKRTGIRVNTAMTATRSECVDICATLCRALHLSGMEITLLFAKLLDFVPGKKRKVISVNGPHHGRNVGPDEPPPRCFDGTPGKEN